MSLWGNDVKPKNLTTAEKKEVFATSQGWVREAGSVLSGNDNASATPEVLVAIGGLATNMGSANITQIEFVTTSIGEAAGGNIDVRVRFNERVDITGTPQVTVTNDQAGSGTDATFTADYNSGTGTNEIVFRATYAAADGGIAEDDVLSIGSNAVALNSGTIKDAGTTTNSTITNAAQTGTLTVSA
jgi:hypothetical protein